MNRPPVIGGAATETGFGRRQLKQVYCGKNGGLKDMGCLPTQGQSTPVFLLDGNMF